MPPTNITNINWVTYLENNLIIENKEETFKREKVLALLNTILPNFQRKVEKNIDYKRDIECLLSPFGSYALGGHIRGADIDIVLVCPSMVRRADFYKFFPELLKKQPTITDVECIKRTTVPIIKCVIDSVSIDISFVRLKMQKVKPDINLLDDSLLLNLDETCRASMDGPRVNKFLLNQIKAEDIQVFRKCLQIIKYWAMQRDIYNKPNGYLNGSAWTLLLFKIYLNEKNNNKNITTINITDMLYSFFTTWSDWPWQTPVMFTSSIPGRNGERLSYNDLTEFNDSVMPIVSPCYPVSNVAPFVTRSTLKVMTREFQRAQETLNTPYPPQTIMKKLFNQTNYFKKFNDFICIRTTSLTSNSHDVWTRKMAFAIPQLLELLEPNPNIKHLQTIVKFIEGSYSYKTAQERAALQNGATADEAKMQSMIGGLEPGTLNIIEHYIGIRLQDECTSIDLTEEIRSFLVILDGKRNKNDEDVKWSIKAMKKIDVGKAMGVYPIH